MNFKVAAQNKLEVMVNDSLTSESVVGATVVLKNTFNGVVTDVDGRAIISGIPDGVQEFEISFLGYIKKSFSLSFPLPQSQPLYILLQPDDRQLDEVAITTSRTNSRIEDAPLKVEVIGLEDLSEETSIKPGNVSSILGDVSSIQVQSLSSVTNNSTVRMQGLDGKYTLLLRDGMPSFGGLSGGLSILQIPPLDLKQVEIIKGPASTINGGGAIAGLINFVSKQPVDSAESVFTINQSTLSETDLNTYFSNKKNKTGYTFLASCTSQRATDVDNDNFSDVPEVKSFFLHPRLFFDLSKNSKIIVGVSASGEDRIGGDMNAVVSETNSLHRYFHSVKTDRLAVDVVYNYLQQNKNKWSFKSSVNQFCRKEGTNSSAVNGRQWNVYSELYYAVPSENHQFVFGSNFLADDYSKLSNDTFSPRDFNNHTVGFFSQYELNYKHAANLQLGIRSDYHSTYGWFVIPSAAALVHLHKNFSLRINGGAGYKTPDLLELTETSLSENQSTFHFDDAIRSETSVGGTFEWNYKKVFANDLVLFINQTYFFTEVDNSIVESLNTEKTSLYINSSHVLSTKGIDNYIRISKHPYELYAGYTYTEPENSIEEKQPYVTYTPLHRFALTLVDEITEQWRLGFETSYNGFQYRDSGSKTPGYFFLAASVQYKTGGFTFVLNGENLLDFRQSSSERIVSGTPVSPQFKKLWAPVDGRVLNFSVMLKI